MFKNGVRGKTHWRAAFQPYKTIAIESRYAEQYTWV